MRQLIKIFLVLLCAITAQAQATGGNGQGMAAGLEYEHGLTPTQPVSPYKGSVAIAVPLYSLTSSGITLPISLQYNSSGVKVENNRGGLVGLNWALQAGGTIIRLPRSRPDEFKNTNNPDSWGAGYMRIGAYCSSNPTYQICQVDRTVWNSVGTSLSYTPDVYGRFNRAFWVTHKRDGAPDDFMLSALGHNIKFMFSEAGEIFATEAVKIEYTLGLFRDPLQRHSYDDVITNWRVTLSDGTILVFGQPEATSVRAAYYDGWPQSASSSTMNKWMLTQVITAQGHNAFTLSYTPQIDDSSLCLADDHALTVSGIRPQFTWLCKASELNVSNYGGIQYLLTRIESKDQNISFAYQLLDYVRGSRLTSVQVNTRTGELLRKYDLTYVTPQTTGAWWLLLEQVKEQSADGNALNGKYRFEYNSQEIPYFNYRPFTSVAENTAGIDHWGYFNGIKSPYSSLTPDVSSIRLPTGNVLPTISGRSPDPVAMLAMSLKKMWLPTGGFIEYEFEPHDYSYVGNGLIKGSRITAGGLRIKSIRQHDSGTSSNDIVTSYDYSSLTNASLSSGVIDNEPVYTHTYTKTADAFSSAFSLSIHKSQPIQSTDIGYSVVTARRSDGGKTVYRFTTALDYPHSTYPLNGVGEYVQFIYNNQSVASQRRPHPFVKYPGRYDYMRGLALETTQYSADGDVTHHIINTYRAREICHLPAYGHHTIEGYFATNITPRDMVFTRIYSISLGAPQLTHSEERVYDMNSSSRSLLTTKTFNYNAINHRPSSVITQTGSELFTTRYYYPVDYTNSAANSAVWSMRTKHMLVQPVEVRTERNGKIIAGQLTEYDANGLPLSLYSLKAFTPLPSLSHLPASYLSNINLYSKQSAMTFAPGLFSPLSQFRPGGPAASVLWGRNGTHKIAEIIGPEVTESRQTQYAAWSNTTTLNSDGSLLFFNLPEDNEVDVSLTVRQTDATKYGKKPFTIRILNQDTYEWIHTEIFVNQSPGTPLYRRFRLAVPKGNYGIYCYYFGGGTYVSPMQVSASVDRIEVHRTAFHTSFEEEFGAISGNGQSKTGSRSHSGTYRVPLPAQPGTYQLSYWTKPINGGTWQYQQESIAVTSTIATTRTIGTAGLLLDEVRLQPTGSQMTTYTYHPVFGKTSETGPSGLSTYFEYDGLGRLKLVRNDRGDIVKAYQYHTIP